MRQFQGYGDILEDDVELAHQTGSRFDAQINRLKHHDRSATSLSKMEAVRFNGEVKRAILITDEASKCKFVNGNMELSANERRSLRWREMNQEKPFLVRYKKKHSKTE